MGFFTRTLYVFAVAVVVSSRPANKTCNEVLEQQVHEAGCRLIGRLPDRWLLRFDSFGASNESVPVLALVFGLADPTTHIESSKCVSQMTASLAMQGMAKVALPASTARVFFAAKAKVTAELSWPGPEVDDLYVGGWELMDSSHDEVETTKEADFLLQVTREAALTAIRRQLPRLLLKVLKPRPPTILQ
ncbi:hypothetical protein HPB50_003817 [Hyalomma asiaticum]|uniref:Uncharacterized protein n=1 Tax=Hyalomma asiaticum TaxID=266040 RepID=A0ACB7TBS2_HYAAI|nr:hypothetical protein HPB50_003817 [Hyalomma asiaticum]